MPIREDLSVRKCMVFTELIAQDASRLGITPQELLFTVSEIIAHTCLRRGMNIDEILGAVRGIYETARKMKGGA